jgi:transposase
MSAESKSSRKTSYPSSTFSLAGSTEREAILAEKKDYNKLRKENKGVSAKELDVLKAALRAEKKANPVVRRCRLIRLDLQPKQHAHLCRWFKDTRKTYNLALGYVLDQQLHRNPELLHNAFPKKTKSTSIDPKVEPVPNYKGRVDFNTLEAVLNKRYVSEKGRAGWTHRELLNRTPKVPRQQAVKRVRNVLETYCTNYTNRLKRRQMYPTARKFKEDYRIQPKYKPNRMKEDTLQFEAGNSVKWVDESTFTLYPKSGLGPLKTRDRITPSMFESQVSIHYKLGKMYLMVTELVRVVARRKVVSPHSACAIDPGIRKFMTVYSPEGQVDVLGGNSTKVLNKLHRRISKTKAKSEASYLLCSDAKRDGASHQIKRRLRATLTKRTRTYRSAETKAVNTIKDLHYKTAHFICQTYNTILYPYFNAQAIVQGKLDPGVKRRANTLSFFKFAQRLVQTSTFYSGTVVYRGSEAYTSRQCGRCGHHNDKLGGKETFTCKECSATLDRDVHGARNIFLRNLI